MGLPTKVAIWTFGVVSLVALLTLGAVFAQTQHTYHRDFLRNSQQGLEILATAIGPDLAAGKHSRVQATVDSVANFPERYPDLVNIRVFGTNKRVVAAYDPRDFGKHLSQLKTGNIQEDVEHGVVNFQIPVRMAYTVGNIEATLSEARYRSALRAAFLSGGILVGVAALVLSLVLFLTLKFQISDRIVKLADAATNFREGHMDQRVASVGNDEITSLGVSFNRMAEAIQKYTENLQQLVRERTRALQQANEQLSRMVITDSLTGLFNRRHFVERARRDLEIARRSGKPFSLVMCDLDHFKNINDQYGHSVGDDVLQSTAEVLQSEARLADLVARLGGEEFAIAMPNTSLPYAAAAAERLRAAIEQADKSRSGLPPITASFGVASFPQHGENLEELMISVDEAMYAAKKSGRNSVAPAKIDEQARTLTSYRK
ncbi:MAG: diguanylate cyclase [Myxococcales bacterium]|nr:MAG: diguanylate cyclase [Myxococcales bacterium]